MLLERPKELPKFNYFVLVLETAKLSMFFHCCSCFHKMSVLLSGGRVENLQGTVVVPDPGDPFSPVSVVLCPTAGELHSLSWFSHMLIYKKREFRKVLN